MKLLNTLISFFTFKKKHTLEDVKQGKVRDIQEINTIIRSERITRHNKIK